MDLAPQLYRLLNSTHHLLNSTNSTLAEDCWLCLSLGLPQVLALSPKLPELKELEVWLKWQSTCVGSSNL
jgi:hypothetical protein